MNTLPRRLLILISLLLVVCASSRADDKKPLALSEQFAQRLSASTLAEQRQLLHDWAVNVVLPDLGGSASQVDEKFAGVRAMGQLILKADFSRPIDVSGLTYRNPDYWRGIMEMVPGNPLIAAMPAFMHLANGEWDQALQLFTILGAGAAGENTPATYVRDALGHLKSCRITLEAEINRGIARHDQGKYDEAIAIYQGILATGIRSAWARYELFFSTAQKGGPKAMIQSMDGSGPESWPAAAKEIYAMDPLYTAQFSGKRGKDMAALIDRMTLKSLWTKKDLAPGQKLTTYADLALKLEDYPVAAHVYWFSLGVKDTGLTTEERITRFLYCLEKLGSPT